MFRRLLLLALKLIALTSLLVAGDKPQTVQEYRNQARRQEGDSERGAKIFVNERAMCSQCHTTDGSGDKAGPDLQSAGDKFSRDDLAMPFR